MSLCVPFPSRSRDQYMSAIMLLLLLLFYCFIFSALHWPWYKYPLRRGRTGRRAAALCPAPPQLFTPWQKHQPRCVSRGSHEPPGDVWFPPHSLLGTAGRSPSHQSPKRGTKVWMGTCSRVPESRGGHGGPVPGRSRSAAFPVAAQGSPWSRPCLSKHVPSPRAPTETHSSDCVVPQPGGTSGSWSPGTFFHKCRA